MKMRKFILLLFVPVSLCSSTTSPKSISGNPFKDTLVKVTVFAAPDSSSSSSSSIQIGHAFLSIFNEYSDPIVIGKMHVNSLEGITLGTWGNKDGHVGLWYNMERRTGIGDRVSLSTYLKADKFNKLTAYINSHDEWTLFNNCSTFASGAWNTISDEIINAGAINTPAGLKASILSYKNHKVNDSIYSTDNIGYYDSNNKFVYVPA